MLLAKISVYLMLSFAHPTTLSGLSLSSHPSHFSLWVPCSSVIIIHLHLSTSSLFSPEPCETTERTKFHRALRASASHLRQLAPTSAFPPVSAGELSVLQNALTSLRPRFHVLCLLRDIAPFSVFSFPSVTSFPSLLD